MHSLISGFENHGHEYVTPSMFDDQYPNLAAWILGGNAWIELGRDEMSRSYVRVLDIGGMIWESERRYQTVAEALADAENALAAWLGEN